MVIVLESGKRFSGKDTIAMYLPELKRISVADTMKREFMKANPEIDMFDRDQKEAHRNELVKFTHQHDLMYWLTKTQYEDNCIVTDIRTLLEIDYLKKTFSDCQVIVVRLNVDNEQRAKRGWIPNKEYDESYLETELDNYQFDLVLSNNVKSDIKNNVFQIRQLMKNSHFIDIGFGFRQTKKLFHGIPFYNSQQLLKIVQYRDPALSNLVTKIKQLPIQPTHVLAIESGGYPLGAFLSQILGIGFIMTRKPGKLPPPTIKVNYSMEYRPENEMEIQADAFSDHPDAQVIVSDDVIATGGTLKGGMELVGLAGATPIAVVSFAYMIIKNKEGVNKSYIDTFDVPALCYLELDGDKARVV